MSDDQEMHGDPEAAGGLSGSAARQRTRRIAKLDALRARGIDPYPVTYPRDRDVASVRAEYAELAAGAVTGDEVHLAGRLMLIRNHGGLLFAQLKDESGTIQLFISREAMGEQGFADARELDIGDWVGAAGTVMVTDTGELSVATTSLTLLGKALRPLPTKGHGLTDAETRFRQRYMDLVLNPESRRVADVRQRTVAAIREFLGGRGLRRGGDAGAPVRRRGRHGAPVHHAPQRAQPRDVPADRARALPQAPDRRRVREGLRDGPRVPQRGPRHPAQPRVHDARGLRGARGLPRHDGADRADGGPRGDGRQRHHRHPDRRPAGRPRPALAPRDDVRAHQGAPGHRHPPVDAGGGGPPHRRRGRRGVRGGLGQRQDLRRDLRRRGRAPAGGPDLRVRPPARDVAAGARAPGRPHPGGALRGGRGRARAGQRLQRADRPGRPAHPLRGRGAARRPPATSRRATSTRTTCGPWRWACRPPAAWASAWTGW